MVNVTINDNQLSLARYDVEVDAPRPGMPHVYIFLQMWSEANQNTLHFDSTNRKWTLQNLSIIYHFEKAYKLLA